MEIASAKERIMNNPNEKFDLKSCLIDKSFEAYSLALETINRITIQYRLETFCYLLINAWELLLKAKILEKTGDQSSIYYNMQKGKSKRSRSLQNCLQRIMPNQKDPIRRNIERIEELRNESVHLVINQIPRDVIALFQAGVINYHAHLKQWFGRSLSDKFPVGMMSIVYDIGPDQLDITDNRLQKQLGKDAATYLSKYCAEINKEYKQLQRSAQFSIGIEYNLVLTKKSDNADIVLSSGTSDSEPTQILQVPKDPSTTHPYRQKEVIDCFKKESNGQQINQYDLQCVNKTYKIKTQTDFFYQGSVKGSPGQYSQKFVDWLVQQYCQDKQFFQKTRKKAKK